MTFPKCEIYSLRNFWFTKWLGLRLTKTGKYGKLTIKMVSFQTRPPSSRQFVDQFVQWELVQLVPERRKTTAYTRNTRSYSVFRACCCSSLFCAGLFRNTSIWGLLELNWSDNLSLMNYFLPKNQLLAWNSFPHRREHMEKPKSPPWVTEDRWYRRTVFLRKRERSCRCAWWFQQDGTIWCIANITIDLLRNERWCQRPPRGIFAWRIV